MGSNDMIVDTSLHIDAQRAATMLADREHGHRDTSALFGHQHSTSPRAALGLLWAITRADLATGTGELLIRANQPIHHQPAWVQHHSSVSWTPRPTLGEQVSFRVELAAHKSPSVPMPADVRTSLKHGATGEQRPTGQGLCWRPNKITVPDHELHQWTQRKLARSGIDATPDQTHRATIWIPRKRLSLPVIQIRAHGTITDPTAWHEALRHGIPGKGKAYGCGTILLEN